MMQNLNCPGCGEKFVKAAALIAHIDSNTCSQITKDQLSRLQVMQEIYKIQLSTLDGDEDDGDTRAGSTMGDSDFVGTRDGSVAASTVYGSYVDDVPESSACSSKDFMSSKEFLSSEDFVPGKEFMSAKAAGKQKVPIEEPAGSGMRIKSTGSSTIGESLIEKIRNLDVDGFKGSARNSESKSVKNQKAYVKAFPAISANQPTQANDSASIWSNFKDKMPKPSMPEAAARTSGMAMEAFANAHPPDEEKAWDEKKSKDMRERLADMIVGGDHTISSVLRNPDGTICEEIDPKSYKFNPGMFRNSMGMFRCPHVGCW